MTILVNLTEPTGLAADDANVRYVTSAQNDDSDAVIALYNVDQPWFPQPAYSVVRDSETGKCGYWMQWSNDTATPVSIVKAEDGTHLVTARDDYVIDLGGLPGRLTKGGGPVRGRQLGEQEEVDDLVPGRAAAEEEGVDGVYNLAPLAPTVGVAVEAVHSDSAGGSNTRPF